MVPQVQGIISAMSGVGTALALPIGSYIAQNHGWEWTYHSIIPVALIILVVSFKVLRESRYRSPGRVDCIGLILPSFFSSLGLIAVTIAPVIGWESTSTISLFIISLLSIILFICVGEKSG